MSTIDLGALVGRPGAGAGAGPCPATRGTVAHMLVDVANANCRGALLAAQGYALSVYNELRVPDDYYRFYIPKRASVPPLRVPSPEGIILPASHQWVYTAPEQARVSLWHEMLDHLAQALGLAAWPASPAQLSLTASAECTYQDASGLTLSAFQNNVIVFRLCLVP